MSLHADELDVSAALVGELLRQRPEFAGRPVEPLAASGSSNALFRLGDDLLVRLPRQPGGSATIAKEARWLPVLAPALPVAVPAVVAVGEPSAAYPERWSVVRWVDGEHPATPSSGPELARDLADLVRALRAAPVPPQAAHDPDLRWYRAGPLAAVDDDVRGYLDECRRLDGLDLDLDACERVWSDAVALPGADPAAPRWLHGDLFAENLLVRDGRLAAVLDFGGLSLGDPAADLAVAWEVLDDRSRALFHARVDVDEATWLRGRGWALAIALMTFPYYWSTMPRRCRSRLVMAKAVVRDAARREVTRG